MGSNIRYTNPVFPNCFFYICQGSLIDCQDSVLVNPISGREENLKRCGFVAKAFDEATGGKLQEALMEKGFPKRFGKDVVTTEAFGNIKSEYIFNIFIMPCRNSESYKLMKRMILVCLLEASSKNCKSIAFPTLGCGILNYDPNKISLCFLQAYKEFLDNYPKNANINVRIQAFDSDTFRKFKMGFNYSDIKKTNPNNNEAFKVDETVKFPEYWSLNLLTNRHFNKSRRTLLDKNSKIYMEILSIVSLTWESEYSGGIGKDAVGLKHSRISVTNIFIIENSHLYLDYVNSKISLRRKIRSGLCDIPDLEENEPSTSYYLDELEKGLDTDLNEYYLFHGTKKDIVPTIENSGIDPRFCSGRVLFGNGSYFAESPTKADQYADDPMNRNYKSPLYMFLARVILGNSHVPSEPKSFRKPPCVKWACNKGDTCSEHPSCDSVIGLSKPNGDQLLFKEFIVYDSKVSCPEFLIEYIREN